MKHTTVQLMKFKKLKRRFRLPEWQATGLLESLWHCTACNAPDGALGRLSNEDIAAAIEWDGDADDLVGTLVELGWLDLCTTNRFVVHDWSDHAPNFIKGNLAKHKKPFALATCSEQPAKATCSEQPAQATLPPNLTKPNLTKPNQDAAKSPLVFPLEFEDFWKKYPANANGRKRGKAKALRLWRKIPAADHGILLVAADNYRREQTEYIRDPERFLADDWWRDWVDQAGRAGGEPEHRKPQPMTADQIRFQFRKDSNYNPRDVNDWSDARCFEEYKKWMDIFKRPPAKVVNQGAKNE